MLGVFFLLGCFWFAIGTFLPVLGYTLGIICWLIAGCSLIYEGK